MFMLTDLFVRLLVLIFLLFFIRVFISKYYFFKFFTSHFLKIVIDVMGLDWVCVCLYFIESHSSSLDQYGLENDEYLYRFILDISNSFAD